MTEAAKSTHKVSIDLADFVCLLEAAQFGAKKADGFKSVSTIRAWRKTIDMFEQLPLSDGRTGAEREEAYISGFAKECAQHGAD